MSGDMVNHPSHYTNTPFGLEVIEITQHYDFCIGNALKYILRAGKKQGEEEIQELMKARWYLDRKIKLLEQRQDGG